MDPKSVGRRCAFCARRSDEVDITAEDAWPNWIRKHLDSESATIAFHRRGKPPRSLAAPSEEKGMGLKVNDVCKTCNNGWMERLERRVQPHFRQMIGKPTTLRLSRAAQEDIAIWAYKTAMVFSLIGFNYYNEDERRAFTTSLTLPKARPLVWLGAFVGTHLACAVDSHMYFDVTTVDGPPREIQGYCVTITVGHVALQIFDIRGPKDLTAIRPFPADKFERWEMAMVPIWPTKFEQVTWPPHYVHDNRSLSELINRWRGPD